MMIAASTHTARTRCSLLLMLLVVVLEVLFHYNKKYTKMFLALSHQPQSEDR